MGEAAEAPAQDFELHRQPGYDNTFVLSGMYWDLSPGDRRVLLDDWYKKLQATLAEKNKGMTGIFKEMVRKLLEGLGGPLQRRPGGGGFVLQGMWAGRVERAQL